MLADQRRKLTLEAGLVPVSRVGEDNESLFDEYVNPVWVMRVFGVKLMQRSAGSVLATEVLVTRLVFAPGSDPAYINVWQSNDEIVQSFAEARLGRI